MKNAFCVALVATGLFTGMSAGAEILNIPYTAGQLVGCTEMFSQDAVIATVPHAGCGVRIPIPLESGRLLKQVKVLSSSSESSGDYRVIGMIMLKVYKTMPDAGEVAFAFPSFDSTMSPGAGMVAGALMSQSGIPPHISYSDAFVLQPDRAYSVNAIVMDDAMFHGIQLVYE